MFEYLQLQNSSEQPTSLGILIAVLSSFFLSSLVVFTYEMTHKKVAKPAYFLQSLALISIVACTVMHAIGDSVARGLGMLGALAIIRFRTNLDNPINMTFMFASLAIGISCGVFGFTIAFIGTVVFCCAAFILRYSPIAFKNELTGNLRLRIPLHSVADTMMDKILDKHCFTYNINQYRLISRPVKIVESTDDDTPDSIRPETKIKEITYHLRLKKNQTAEQLLDDIKKLEDASEIRLRFNSPPENL